MIKTLRLIRAFLNRTFVTDCPLCHKHFYGFHDYQINKKIDNKTYRIICHRCADKYEKTHPNV